MLHCSYVLCSAAETSPVSDDHDDHDDHDMIPNGVGLLFFSYCRRSRDTLAAYVLPALQSSLVLGDVPPTSLSNAYEHTADFGAPPERGFAASINLKCVSRHQPSQRKVSSENAPLLPVRLVRDLRRLHDMPFSFVFCCGTEACPRVRVHSRGSSGGDGAAERLEGEGCPDPFPAPHARPEDLQVRCDRQTDRRNRRMNSSAHRSMERAFLSKLMFSKGTINCCPANKIQPCSPRSNCLMLRFAGDISVTFPQGGGGRIPCGPGQPTPPDKLHPLHTRH